MLEDALQYPFRGRDSTERLIIGGALPFLATAIYLVGALLSIILIGYLLMPFALVPRVLFWGYLVTAIGAILTGRPEPPAFDDWKAFAINGLKAVLVTLAYSLPLLVGGFVFVILAAITGTFVQEVGEAGGTASAAAAASPGVGAAFGIVLALLGLLALAFAVAMYYVLPAAVVNFVREDDIAAAFNLRTIADIVWNGDYLVAWLLALLVVVVGNLIAFPLYFILVGFVLRFVVMLAATYLVTRSVMQSMGWEPDDASESTEPAATDPDQTTLDEDTALGA